MSAPKQICTTCYFHGFPNKSADGLLSLIGWLLLTPLMLILWLVGTKYKTGGLCPKCNQRTMIPADTPRGGELLAKSEAFASSIAASHLEKRRSDEELPPSSTAGIQYMFSIILVFTGLAAFSQSQAVDGICQLIMAAIIFPPVRQQYLANTPLKSARVSALVIFVLMMFMVSSHATGPTTSVRAKEAVPSTASPSVKPQMAVKHKQRNAQPE